MLGDCDKTGRSNLEPRWPLFKKGQAVTHGEKQVTGIHERDFPSSFFFFFSKSCQSPEEEKRKDCGWVFGKRSTQAHRQKGEEINRSGDE